MTGLKSVKTIIFWPSKALMEAYEDDTFERYGSELNAVLNLQECYN